MGSACVIRWAFEKSLFRKPFSLRSNFRSLPHETVDGLLQLQIAFIRYGHYVRKQ
jgi:hypothetical protein